MTRKKAYEMAMQALSQECVGSTQKHVGNALDMRCDDAINRQAVDTLVDELARAISDERCCMSRGRSTATIMQDILDLPSVNPQPKTGHWIEVTNGRGGHECSLCHVYAPSYQNGDEWLTKYCPNCGVRMIEPQERSDE